MNVLIILGIVLAIDFGLVSLLVWVGSLILPYTFSWTLSLFTWLLTIVLGAIFKK